MKISLVIPYRNRDLTLFQKFVADSISMQTRDFDEILIADFQSSNEANKQQMKYLCNLYDFAYKEFNLDASDVAVDLFLWSTLLNNMIRNAKGDVVIVSGIDKLLENDVAESIEKCYNTYGDNMIIRTKAWQTKEDPLTFVWDFNSLAERCYIRGYGFWGATKEMFHKCHGINEKLRWFEDMEMFGRGKIHKIPLPWINNGKKDFCRVIHFFGSHIHSKNVYNRDDIRPIYRLGKSIARIKDRPLEANDENWGIITQEKIDLAERLAKTVRTK